MPYKDPEQDRLYKARYRAKHRQKAREYAQAYRAGIRIPRIPKSAPPKQTSRPEPMTAEERAARQRARQQRYYAEHAEEIRAKARLRKARYLQEHPEKVRAQSRAWAAAHREVARSRARAWYFANRDRAKSSRKAWRASHRQQRNAAERAWKAANPEKVRASKNRYYIRHREIYNGYVAQRRAAKAQSQHNDLTIEQWREIKAAYGYRCVYCGKKSQRLTQDHIIPLSQGGSHTASNIVPACKPCNSRKQAGSPPVPVQPMLLTIAPAKRKK